MSYCNHCAISFDNTLYRCKDKQDNDIPDLLSLQPDFPAAPQCHQPSVSMALTDISAILFDERNSSIPEAFVALTIVFVLTIMLHQFRLPASLELQVPIA